MNIDEVIKKNVRLMVFQTDGLDAAGINEKTSYAKAVGWDSTGLWIENLGLETTRVRDENGRLIPPEQRIHEEHVAHVLVPWGNIRSLVHVPTREGGDTGKDEATQAIRRGMYL